MPSGVKEIVINSLERAVSTDINRLQKFNNAAAAELFRALMNTAMGTDDSQGGGLFTPNTTTGTPLSAELFGGSFLVQPQLGNFNVLVSPGVGFFFFPDGAPDDSLYKFAADAGVPSAGTLTMATNPAGQTRIDVVECSWAVNNTLETDNRDIFNPATGAFAPATVTKAIGAQLTYRIRQGTAGGGFPGLQQGWLPLAVASVPGGSPASNDAITWWDVRPLISDRVTPPFNRTASSTRHGDIDLVGDAFLVGGGVILLAGRVDVVPYDSVNGVAGLRRLGGFIRRGTPGVDAISVFPGLDMNDAANQSATFAGGGINYVYLLEPAGLPRWCRYTDASSGSRVPRSPKGIPVITSVAPAGTYFAEPISAVPMPASTGLGISATMGSCIAAINYGGTVVACFLTRRGQSTNQAFGTSAFAPTNQAATSVTFTFTQGVTHPAHAAWVEVTITLTVLQPATSTGQVTILSTIQDNAGNNLAIHPNVGENWPIVNFSGAPQSWTFPVKIRVPVDPLYATQRLLLAGTFVGGGAFVNGGHAMNVTGFGT